MSDVEHVDFLREESAIALSDGCPVAAGRLTRAADALEQAQKQIDSLQAKVHLCAGYDKLQERVEQLEEALQFVKAEIGPIDGTMKSWLKIAEVLPSVPEKRK